MHASLPPGLLPSCDHTVVEGLGAAGAHDSVESESGDGARLQQQLDVGVFDSRRQLALAAGLNASPALAQGSSFPEARIL